MDRKIRFWLYYTRYQKMLIDYWKKKAEDKPDYGRTTK